jgi:CubicO group peptidase (beta-lactamase class C family)
VRFYPATVRSIPLVLLCIAASAASAVSQGVTRSVSPTELRLRLEHNAPLWLAQYDVPSVAVAYIENGKLAWTSVTGEQSPGVRASGKTLYNLASLTKPITAEVVLRLAAAHQLSLDEPLSRFWVDPDVKDNSYTAELTPRICLSHQTGFPNWRRMTGGVLRYSFEPGTNTGYSGEGYEYLARFVEKKTGNEFPEIAKQYVFEPFGMKNSSYSEQPWYRRHLAVPRGPVGEADPNGHLAWSAADLVRTTIGDYAKFVVAVMHGDGLTPALVREQRTLTRNRVDQSAVTKLCTAAGVAKPEDCRGSAGMGLGWEVESLNGETIIGHSGSDWGVHTLVFFLPERKLGVVVFTNGENGGNVIKEVASLLYPNPIFVATLAQ